MSLNDPVHLENFTCYVKKLPFNEDSIKLMIQSSSIGKNPMFYLEYASLFENSFKIKNAGQKIKLLNIAGYLCYNYSLLLDSALDKETKHSTLLLSNLYLEESIKLLTKLFGLDKKFWSLWNLRKYEVFGASKTGKKMFNYSVVSIHEFETLCDCKSALGKVALDALFILSGSMAKDNYEKLMESHKYFSIGFQINDDIDDLIDDYENKDFNFAYYKYVVEKNIEIGNITDLKKMFYISGAATDLYNLALFYFRKSLTVAQEVGENTWVQAITGKIKETETTISSIEEYLTIINAKVSLKANSVSINSFVYSFDENSTIEKGLNYLIREWEKNYPEVKHIMVLSNLEGFENEKTLHVTDIFQRGILTNNLIDIANNYEIDISKIIDHEIGYLVQNRNKDGVGCWSYFPTVKEIAPDADDLGQIMQVFIKHNETKHIEDYCHSGIRILIEDCYNIKTGGIETWIIPKINPSDNQRIQKEFNEAKWGVGPDIDVMANFLYALCLYHFECYKDVIKNGVKYIYSKIEDGCFWNSRWYYGWQYGTMICIRLGVEVLKHNAKLQSIYTKAFYRIKNNIIKTQKIDGGWSINSTANSDPLNTSFALITLMLLDKSYYDTEILKKGIDFLKNTQKADGSWEAIPFIKPRLNVPYKSIGITTSYALNALTTYDETNRIRKYNS
jgi:squalene-hopene/tetraprenyl-beta-curcumene cyclase